MRRNGELSPDFPLLSRIGRVRKIKAVVCAHYEISHEELVSEDRELRVAWPRQVAMWLIRKRTGISYPLIAKAMGRGDHTTIMHGVKRVETLRCGHVEIADDMRVLEAAVEGVLSPSGDQT